MSPIVAAELKDVTPAQVVLILGLSTILAATIIWLAIIGNDPVAIISGIAPILLLIGGAFGWAKVNDLKRDVGGVKSDVGEVRSLSNGQLTELREDNKALHAKVASLSMLIRPSDTELSADTPQQP